LRPAYESERDRENERRVVNCFCAAYGLEAAKLPIAYQLDFALLKGGRVLGLAEVKWRERRYETLLLSLNKWAAMKRWAESGQRVRLLVRWPEGIFLLKVDGSESWPCVMGGRADRGDWQDMEPMVEIPFGAFTLEIEASAALTRETVAVDS
jgi:hypothetical protein